MLNNIEVKLETVKSTISDARTNISNNQSEVNAEYNRVINQFVESSGETADGLKSLQKAEQQLATDMWNVLTELGSAIEFAADEFVKLDGEMRKKMTHTTVKSRLSGGRRNG